MHLKRMMEMIFYTELGKIVQSMSSEDFYEQLKSFCKDDNVAKVKSESLRRFDTGIERNVVHLCCEGSQRARTKIQ